MMRRPSWLETSLAVLVIIFFVMWIQKFVEQQPVGVAVETKPAKILADVGTERKDCVPVVVYKEKAKAKANLPQAVQDDPLKAVLGATEVAPDIHPHLVTPLLDTATGKVVIYDTKLALPWFAIDTNGEAGFAYGQRGGERVLRLEVRQALADIKAVKVGVVAGYDMPLGGGRSDGFVGVGAWYRWR